MLLAFIALNLIPDLALAYVAIPVIDRLAGATDHDSADLEIELHFHLEPTT